MAKRLEVQWTGLDRFEDELAAKAAHLTDEANAILLEAAQAAKAEISAAYPATGTGNLRRGLVLKPARGAVFAGAILRQRAPHGWIYERGTKPRYNKAGAFRGVMHPRPTFEPIATAHRRAALAAIIDRLYAHGADEVTGDVDAA